MVNFEQENTGWANNIPDSREKNINIHMKFRMYTTLKYLSRILDRGVTTTIDCSIKCISSYWQVHFTVADRERFTLIASATCRCIGYSITNWTSKIHECIGAGVEVSQSICSDQLITFDSSPICSQCTLSLNRKIFSCFQRKSTLGPCELIFFRCFLKTLIYCNT